MARNEDLPGINIKGLSFQWEPEAGRFLFEGADAILFWISSAMKTFFDTIEEISGQEAANVVLETTGFRQGLVVGNYFTNMSLKGEQVAGVLPNTYGSAGWGNIVFNHICDKNRTAVVQIKDSWEYKINKAQGKKESGSFLGGHFAGIFSALFGEKIGYRKTKDQIAGDEVCEYEYFPSDFSVETNIHSLTRKQEALQIRKLEKQVDERTKELNDLIREISSPIIPVLDGIVVVPLLGKYDEARSDDLVEKTLHNLPKYKANYLILELTGLTRDIGVYTVELLNKLASAAEMIGTQTILVGITPELAIKITDSKYKLSTLNCFSNLQHGIYHALAEQGRRII